MTGIERKRGPAETMLTTCMVSVATLLVLHDGLLNVLEKLNHLLEEKVPYALVHQLCTNKSLRPWLQMEGAM